MTEYPFLNVDQNGRLKQISILTLPNHMINFWRKILDSHYLLFKIWQLKRYVKQHFQSNKYVFKKIRLVDFESVRLG